MTYREIAEGIKPIEMRIAEVRTLLNDSQFYCRNNFKITESTPAKFLLRNEDDFAIFKNYQKQLKERLNELELQLEEYLNKTVD